MRNFLYLSLKKKRIILYSTLLVHKTGLIKESQENLNFVTFCFINITPNFRKIKCEILVHIWKTSQISPYFLFHIFWEWAFQCLNSLVFLVSWLLTFLAPNMIDSSLWREIQRKSVFSLDKYVQRKKKKQTIFLGTVAQRTKSLPLTPKLFWKSCMEPVELQFVLSSQDSQLVMYQIISRNVL